MLALLALTDRSTAWRAWQWLMLGLALIIFVGLRHQIGTDWPVYEGWVEDSKSLSFADALFLVDPGYAALSWVSGRWGGIYLVNLVCALFAIGGLIYFCRQMPSPTLALVVAAPYLIFVVSMGYTRQSVAIGFGMLAIVEVMRCRSARFLCYVTLAALFHNTAICLFVFLPALFAGSWRRGRGREVITVFAYACALSAVLMWGQFNYLYNNYVYGSDMNASQGAAAFVQRKLYSSGAVARLFQSVLAAIGFVFIASHFKLDASKFWLLTTASIVIFVLFLLSFWRTTLADRMGLFFIFLQIYTFTTVPTLFKPPLQFLLKITVVLGAGASFWVWLNFGLHAQYWVPYENVLLQ